MIEQIHPGQLEDWAQRMQAQTGLRPLLVDVREPFEWQLASVTPPGMDVLHMPMHEVPYQHAQWDEDRPTALLCHHGGRSMQVALYLQQRDFAHLANVLGGIDAWAAQYDPAVPRY